MSQENVELVRRVNALLNAGEWDAALELFDPDIEWRDLMHAPDLPEVLYGVEGLRLLSKQWMDAYDEFGAQVYEFIDADPWVVCDSRWYGRGRGSDVPTEVRSADAYEIRDGKIVRSIGGYPDLATALKEIEPKE